MWWEYKPNTVQFCSKNALFFNLRNFLPIMKNIPRFGPNLKQYVCEKVCMVIHDFFVNLNYKVRHQKIITEIRPSQFQFLAQCLLCLVLRSLTNIYVYVWIFYVKMNSTKKIIASLQFTILQTILMSFGAIKNAFKCTLDRYLWISH